MLLEFLMEMDVRYAMRFGYGRPEQVKMLIAEF